LHFLGRDDALAEIEGALKRRAVAVVHGLRGAGKTTLAAAYAEKHRGDYRATWWIRAQTEPTMRADLVALGVRLGWVKADDKEEPALAAVKERLRNEGEGILLVYDNAVDTASLKPYLPVGGGAKALVTSNAHTWRDIAVHLELPLWPKKIGADYLVARTGREAERAAAEALSVALGGLPLAQEQAASYSDRLGISFTEYKKRFEKAPGRLLDTGRDAPGDYHGGLTVAKTFALAIDEAAKLHPAAEPLIVHAALLAPEPIPLFLFSEAREKFGEPLTSALADDGLDEAVAALRSFALVDKETITDERDPSITTDCIRLHRLVRAVAAARAEGEVREQVLRTLIEAMAAVYPDMTYRGVFIDPETWPREHRLDALALALVGGDATPPKGTEEKSAYLLNRLGAYRQGALAAYGQARPLFERALVISEKVLGPEHPLTAISLDSLAFLVEAQGDFAGARPLYERALTISEKALGAEHPSTAINLHDLARLLFVKGDHAAARPLLERALAISEKALGMEHPQTAMSLHILARLLYSQGEHAEARPLLERALAISEKALGAEHPNTNMARCDLAGLLLVSGNPEEALARGETALAAHEKLLGQDHPWTKRSARITAKVLDALGRADEAAVLRARFGLPREPKPSA
jgi:tetratricopeptide (TPR) repeat protein